jgi:hypothetical protein
MNKREIQYLTSFLKENDCYYQYIKNYNNYSNEYYMPLTILKYSYNLINNAFVWRETNEGFDYWEKKHEEWLDNFSFL